MIPASAVSDTEFIPMPMNNPSIATHFARKALDVADIDPDERELISGFFRNTWLIDALAALTVMHSGHLIRDEEYTKANELMLEWAGETDFFHGELSQHIRSRFMAIIVMTAALILHHQDTIARN
jgi:hypothetical protein